MAVARRRRNKGSAHHGGDGRVYGVVGATSSRSSTTCTVVNVCLLYEQIQQGPMQLFVALLGPFDVSQDEMQLSHVVDYDHQGKGTYEKGCCFGNR